MRVCLLRTPYSVGSKARAYDGDNLSLVWSGMSIGPGLFSFPAAD